MRNRQTQRKPSANENRKTEQPQKLEKYHSWAVVRSLWTCRSQQPQQQVQQLSTPGQSKQQLAQRKLPQEHVVEEGRKECKKMRCSGSLCNNTKVMHRPELPLTDIHRKRNSFGTDNSRNASSRSMKGPLHELNGDVSASTCSISASSHSSSAGSFRSMPFSRFSGCYECRMVVDPVLGFTRDPSLRTSISSCPECGEIFMKAENLELHQAVRHAVSEMGPEDTSKNIVEIIFHSSWLKKETPVCTIERILKVQNTQKTIGKFEEYRDLIKAKATRLPKKHPRCIADGNELLRFHCSTLICSLGLNGSSNLCNSIPQCNVCSIIKSGFRVVGEEHEGTVWKGILTTATSGRAHDSAGITTEEKSNSKRAMLVCRVIAGRVKKNSEGSMEEYDSIAGAAGAYSNLDELYVLDPRAILPCFVVIYTGF